MQGVSENVVAMCKLSSDNVITLIGRDGRVDTFDVSRHAALCNRSIQVRSRVIILVSVTVSVPRIWSSRCCVAVCTG